MDVDIIDYGYVSFGTDLSTAVRNPASLPSMFLPDVRAAQSHVRAGFVYFNASIVNYMFVLSMNAVDTLDSQRRYGIQYNS
jgi:hypothetical protein